MVIRKFIIIILLAPLNGYHVEKYLEAFGGAGGGGWRRPQENLCEDPGINRHSPAKDEKKQKTIKCIYPSSPQEENPGSYRNRFHQLRSVFSPFGRQGKCIL